MGSALYRTNVLIGMVAKLPSCGQVGSGILSFPILWPIVKSCHVVDHAGAYASHQCKGLNSAT
jgi:hypothetical protein